MSANAPTWSVVTTVDEPPALVQSFVAWHLHLGAEKIYLFFDNPDDPAAAMFAHLPQVSVVRCDRDHWLRQGNARPLRHEVRQVGNARAAYATCRSDWLVHIDADEFLWPRGDLGEVLGAASEDADAIIVPVAERVQRPDDPGLTIFEGAFRRPALIRPEEGLRIFGPDYRMTYRGLTDHAQGKSFVRTGRRLSMSIHRPRAEGRDPEMWRPEPEDITLLHFDGLTPAFWTYKLARMQRAFATANGMPPSDHRRAQIDALLEDPDAGAALFRRLKVVDAEKEALLRQHGLWCEVAFDPAPALEMFFPDLRPDLTPEAINRWLAETRPDVIGYLHDKG